MLENALGCRGGGSLIQDTPTSDPRPIDLHNDPSKFEELKKSAPKSSLVVPREVHYLGMGHSS